MATQTGRDQGIPGTGGPGGTQARSDVGLAGAGPPEVKEFIQGKQEGPQGTPSAETQAKYGDVDKAAPNQPITAAKQAMEEERGQTFTSATGKPTQPSPLSM